MKKFLAGAFVVVLLVATAIRAFPQVGGGVVSFFVGSTVTPVSSLNPLPVTSSGGGGGTTIITPTSLAANALTPSATAALGTSLLVKPTPGNLYGFYCDAITGGAAGYCVAYNATAVPSTGALTGANVLDVCYFSGAAGCSLNRMPIPQNYSTGIVILVTTAVTPFTYTTGVDTAYVNADYQ